MSASAQYLRPSDAAKRLGVSAKALRIYEQRGLVVPGRTAAGWRTYGPSEMARASEVVALRALGLTLAQVARVLMGEIHGLEPALAAHQATLEGRVRQLTYALEKIFVLRASLAQDQSPEIIVTFDLPWPWGGERFELSDTRPLNHIIGPLGSGKTQLIKCLAAALPGALFIGLERLAHDSEAARALLRADTALSSRVDQTLAWLVDAGASISSALIALVTALEIEGPANLVVDMLEQGLDQAAQEALIAHLRRRGPAARPFFFTTRSSSILDLAALGADEAIILCPANHSPPIRVAPHPWAIGYEAVATCLASPMVRARTEGVIASRPELASA